MEVRIVLNDKVGSCIVFQKVEMIERDKNFLYIYHFLYPQNTTIVTDRVRSEEIKKVIIKWEK